MHFVFPSSSQTEIDNGKRLKVAQREFAFRWAEGPCLTRVNNSLEGAAVSDCDQLQDSAMITQQGAASATQVSPARKRCVESNRIPRAVGPSQAASAGICTALLFALLPFVAQAKITSKSKSMPDALDTYLATARRQPAQPARATGSLWDPNGRMSDMAADAKARYVGDLVTINIAESTSSAQQESAQTSRAFSASSSLAALLGTTGTREQNLFSPSSNQSLNGKGQTALSTSLTTTLAASVTEVLPDGMLVIEARRDVLVTNQKETMVLRGVIRREDLSPQNAVSSTAISHLEVSLKGNGVVSESTRPPNVVVRILLRVFGF